MTLISRRGFLTGVIAAACAPAIIRTPGLIMPIKASLVAHDGIALTGGIPHPVRVDIPDTASPYVYAFRAGSCGMIIKNARNFYIKPNEFVTFFRVKDGWAPYQYAQGMVVPA